MNTRNLEVMVVGAGITGLLTARHLAAAGARVTIIEASDHIGGQLRSEHLDGRVVDVGAEALHTGAPGVQDLLDDLGLARDVVTAGRGTTWLATARGLRALPAGMGPAGPTRLWPVATSRVLSPAGLLRAASEPLRPRTPLDGDTAVGSYLTGRFGRQVTDRLLDPLLGNLHAGDVNRLSLGAATPQLDRLARSHRSLVLARRGATRGIPGPSFVTVRGGLGRIAAALGSDPRIDLRTATPVKVIEPDGCGYRVVAATGEAWRVDAVVLAVPAAVAARALTPVDQAAAELTRVRTASVATAVVGYHHDVARRLTGTGLLVPSTSPHLLKAATHLSAKWSHLAAGPTFLVRLSAGRAGDGRVEDLDAAELVDRLHADLAALTGLSQRPVSALVHRWQDTMPQLEVGHAERIARIRHRLEGRRIVLAGASYDGVGITSCLGSARRAAEQIVQSDEPSRRPRPMKVSPR